MPRQLKGIVVSDKMTQTCVVKVDIFQKHPRYKKFFVLSKKVKVDNPNSIYKTGDKVIIEETRPISKTKC
ncbi:MAG TPA: 30S ribosomal protein S17 [Candidatus Paceibacterota bacterium]|jgi:small subunit ribosomal protein S17|nr:30S ribosomal protein S17 [Candidatus Paceibacterota bacterium]HRV32008.1 30S ribosomal protein S17 [Candidatus Paceibacterota bacterium]